MPDTCFCGACGAVNYKTNQFCTACGQRIAVAPEPRDSGRATAREVGASTGLRAPASAINPLKPLEHRRLGELTPLDPRRDSPPSPGTGTYAPCPGCGLEVESDEVFCYHCGESLRPGESVDSAIPDDALGMPFLACDDEVTHEDEASPEDEGPTTR